MIVFEALEKNTFFIIIKLPFVIYLEAAEQLPSVFFYFFE